MRQEHTKKTGSKRPLSDLLNDFPPSKKTTVSVFEVDDALTIGEMEEEINVIMMKNGKSHLNLIQNTELRTKAQDIISRMAEQHEKLDSIENTPKHIRSANLFSYAQANYDALQPLIFLCLIFMPSEFWGINSDSEIETLYYQAQSTLFCSNEEYKTLYHVMEIFARLCSTYLLSTADATRILTENITLRSFYSTYLKSLLENLSKENTHDTSHEGLSLPNNISIPKTSSQLNSSSPNKQTEAQSLSL